MKTSRTHRLLAALLAAQLLLAGALAWWATRERGAGGATALFALDQGAADKLTIEGPDKARVDITRKDGNWVVAQAGDFAADAKQVTQLLSRLSGLKASMPLATSAEAAERFKVADASFERRIVVEARGKPQATLLLGTSQGSRQTFARKSGDSAVVSVDLAAYEVQTKIDDWLDRTVVRVPRDDVAAIEVHGLKLVRGAAGAPPQAASAPLGAPAATAPASAASTAGAPAEPTWTAEGLSRNERLDASAADKLLTAISDLQFTTLKGRDDAARKGLGAAKLTLAVLRRDGQRLEYRLYALPGGEDEHALVLSSRAETFGLAAHAARALNEAASRSALVRTTTTK